MPDPRGAAALCRAKIEEADLFLGLYAHRYGFQPDGFDGKSITQLEYEWARERRPAPTVPAFIVDDDLPWSPSALTWKWFHDRAPRDLAGKMWWSFYESDAGFDRFVTMALAYCGRRSIQSVQELSPVDREWQLLSLLDREPFLITLDGLERILLAYANLNFAHLTDDDLDRRTANSVAGAMGLPAEAGETFVARHRLRQTTCRTRHATCCTPLPPSDLRSTTRLSAASFLPGASGT